MLLRKDKMTVISRILGVDPGEKRLGIAISDPTQTIAAPLTILNHISLKEDTLAILTIAEENQVSLILIGQAQDWDGEVSYQGEKSVKLAEEIRSQGIIPILLWDEYGSTKAAQLSRQQMNLPRSKRKGHHDDIAAVIILQSYLDAQSDLEKS
jgi:putative Holliday junction resolvase